MRRGSSRTAESRLLRRFKKRIRSASPAQRVLRGGRHGEIRVNRAKRIPLANNNRRAKRYRKCRRRAVLGGSLQERATAPVTKVRNPANIRSIRPAFPPCRRGPYSEDRRCSARSVLRTLWSMRRRRRAARRRRACASESQPMKSNGGAAAADKNAREPRVRDPWNRRIRERPQLCIHNDCRKSSQRRFGLREH